MKTLILLLCSIAPFLYSQVPQPFQCNLQNTQGVTPPTGIVKPIILYCVNLGENDVLPAYLNNIPPRIDDYYNKASGGIFRVQVAHVIKKDSSHAIMGSIDYGGTGPYIASNAFIRNVLSQADSLYDLGQFDNDGPDGIPNSGDDDGYVDFTIFWMLNYSARGIAGLYDMNGDFVTKDTSWGSGHTFSGFIKVSPDIPYAVECRKDLRDNLEFEADYLGATLQFGQRGGENRGWHLGELLGNHPVGDHVDDVLDHLGNH